ncbi:MAG TPA: hypothetical protein VK463_19555 [Desulfomonilaceae bacterium]|nr:hypothetical protein [Desulfomonilaceae bacterium]
MKNHKFLGIHWFPAERFAPDFPLAVWFAGLWFYLKSFLYVSYVYMLGLEPPPYTGATLVEIIYFLVTMVPFLLLGMAMWNRKEKFYVPAVVLLGIDTPFLLFHVFRLAQGGFLDSGLTKVLEFGSLGLNVVALAWLIGYLSARKSMAAKSAPKNSK